MNNLKLVRRFFSNSVQVNFEYRFDFVMSLINSILSVVASLSILWTMFEHKDSIAGWGFMKVVVLVGVFRIFKGVIDVFIAPNLSLIPDYIREGTLDFILIKPVNSQIMISFRTVNIWRISEIIIGLILVVIGFLNQNTANLLDLIMGVILILLGGLIIYSIWLIFMTMSFWLIDLRNLPTVFNVTFDLAQFPVYVFPGWLRFILTFIIPIAFVTTVPAEAISNLWNVKDLMSSGTLTIVLLIISTSFWKYAISRYTSASS
ncbi:ABC transporter permease [Bacillus cereus]|uniref:ABC transporter permease n=1 Tax=Bacillus cereus HuA3-9 TaxID=1053205 RepID=R8CB08_BACCE|nr:ABC-2 family transporter protein [Bacillus cereus]EOO08759.1 hypothetical protein IGA_06333 [Bacillus cereus HuA3-9]